MNTPNDISIDSAVLHGSPTYVTLFATSNGNSCCDHHTHTHTHTHMDKQADYATSVGIGHIYAMHAIMRYGL